MERNAQVNLLLNAINSSKYKLVSMYKVEYEMLRRLAPISPERVVKDGSGNPIVFYIDKEKAIKTLKNIYNFKTKEEAAIEVVEASKESK